MLLLQVFKSLCCVIVSSNTQTDQVNISFTTRKQESCEMKHFWTLLTAANTILCTQLDACFLLYRSVFLYMIISLCSPCDGAREMEIGTKWLLLNTVGYGVPLSSSLPCEITIAWLVLIVTSVGLTQGTTRHSRKLTQQEVHHG